MKKEKQAVSLKWGFFTTVLLCWVIPILSIVLIAAALLTNTYEKSFRQTVEAGADHAFEQVENQLASALEASKAVSYDGVVRDAYRDYEINGNLTSLYSKVTDYLSQSYSRDEKFQAVFLTFLDQKDKVYSCVSPQISSYNVLQSYTTEVRDKAMELLDQTDTGIYFLELDDQLYMIRNLLDKKFEPYAALTMLCDKEVFFRSLWAISGVSEVTISIDDVVIRVKSQPLMTAPQTNERYRVETTCEKEVGGHQLTLTAMAMGLDLSEAIPELPWAIALIALLGVPMLIFVVVLFYRHVSVPLEVLDNAYDRIQGGDRGYQIGEVPPNREFRRMMRHFNHMSTELESQFNRLYMEQQALQQARIKALQSQINPHFLGNTLEIINWEARIAGDEKVYTMIEALSTMLDAAIGRDGRAQIPLEEELTYVDAYLYIIQQRLGDRMTVVKEIDENLLDMEIPRLLLQPLVENAVEHDVAKRQKSQLILRAYDRLDQLYVEVEHDGEITNEDREKIASLLAAPIGPVLSGRVGIRNVNQRLHLLYGESGGLRVFEVRPGRILARAVLPKTKEAKKEGKSKQETAN